MYAIGLNTYGGPEVLHPVELPDPHPAPGQVRVKVRAAGVNPVDVMVRDGSLAEWFAGQTPPFVPGMDIAGEIDELGEGVGSESGLAAGQAVAGIVNNYGSYGGYSQYVCLPTASVVPLQSGWTYAAAASFLMNALIARNALDTLRLPVGSTVLITGAAGAVGANAVALAANEGLLAVAVASPGDAPYLGSLGAASVIQRGDDFATRVRRAFPSGVDAVVDAADLRESVVPAVRDNGTIIALRFRNTPTLERGVHFVFVNVRERSTDHAAIARLGDMAAAGVLPMRVAATYPASAAAAAHARLAQGGLRGRIVLEFGAQ